STRMSTLALHDALPISVVVQGGWKRWNRQLNITAHLGLGLMLMAHAAPLATLLEREPFSIFISPEADLAARPWFGFAGAIVLLASLYELYREWVRVEPAAAAVSADATTTG